MSPDPPTKPATVDFSTFVGNVVEHFSQIHMLVVKFRCSLHGIAHHRCCLAEGRLPGGQQAVQGFAIRKTGTTLKAVHEHATLPLEEVYFVGHQANMMMLQSVCRRGGVPDERHLYNVDVLGNTGASGAPGVISQNWDRFVDGDEIAMVVVGAGLSWAGLLIRFGGTP